MKKPQPECYQCGKIPKFYIFPAKKVFCSDDCYDKFKNGEKPMKKFKVPSQSEKGVKYTVQDNKGKWSCSCDRWVNTSPRQDCKHIKSVKSGKPLPTKEAVMKAKKAAKKANPSILAVKTTRATLINLLKKNAGKLVAIKVIYAEVKRVKGWDDKKLIAKKVAKQRKSVAEWASQHDFKLVANDSGMKFQPQA